MKEEFFSKFKDYNGELEKILEKKDFSKDSKSLLLSMFYKLESSYSDYETVKRKVKSKQEFLENILENIKYCNKIELIKPGTQKFKELENNNIKYNVDLKIKKIEVIDNELYLLAAIMELNNFKIYLNERYNLIRNSFPYLLNTANDMQISEVLRDFNAFSWNTNVKDIENVNINLIYEDLKLALNFDIIRKIQNTNEVKDIVKIIKEDLNKTYGEEITTKFLNIIFKLTIIIYINKSSIERKRLEDERNILTEELEEIKNKKDYIEKIINKKQELSKKIKELDLILNDKELLIKEYEKRNAGKSEYNKIFSLSHLTEKLQREREKTINKIDECSKKLEPKQYIKNKQKLQNDYNLLKDIDFEDVKNDKLLYRYINKLQKILLEKILPQKLETINEKEKLIDFIYQLRYYNLIQYNSEREIKDVKELQENLTNLEKILIKKLYSLKIINTLSTSERNDIEIVRNIFYLRTISLENLYLELFKIEENKYNLNIYDEKDTLEESKDIQLQFNKKDKIKLKRKVKLF